VAYTDYDNLKLAIPEQTLIELTDDPGVGTVDMGKIAGCIEAADSEIDGYMPETETLPLNPVPRLIVRLSTVIAIYNVYARYAETIPKTREDQYNNAIKLLEKILEGKIKLRSAAEAPGAPEPTPARRIKSSAPARIFTDDKLDGFN